ncbi:MAG TPA: dihydroorotate dehydrogenase [Bacteroidota bacterium]|jgi:dihydroorotate dehydrogenase (NAD+) catalytic subunit
MTDLRVDIGTCSFANPVLAASGTFGYGDECRDLVDANLLGGVITKSLSLEPRAGNPPGRIVETPSGMLNSIGLANIGVRRFIAEKLPFLRTLRTRVIANIAASSVDEYCAVLSALELEEGIHGYEINVSCPNVKDGGLSFGTSCEMTAEVTRRLRALTAKTLIIKLTPNVTRIADFARAAADAGADALSVINTLIGMAIDTETRKPSLSTVTGGLSGPAIKPVALAKVYEASQSVRIPVIGVGGIMNARDAIEFLLAGASAVQVGTANFVDPAAGVTIVEGLNEYCLRHRIGSVRELTGGLVAPEGLSVLQSWL